MLVKPRITLLKCVRIRSFSSPHFTAFGPNSKIYRINLRIQSQSKKRTLFTECIFLYSVHIQKYKNRIKLFILMFVTQDVWYQYKLLLMTTLHYTCNNYMTLNINANVKALKIRKY